MRSFEISTDRILLRSWTDGRRLALLLLAIACGAPDDEKSRDSAIVATPVAAPVPPPVSSTGRTGVDDCPATGQWALCSLEKRLKRSGFVARRLEQESPRRAGFSGVPVVYTLGRGQLEVFLYDDAASLAKDIAAIDTITVAPPGTAPSWPSQPGLIRSANLAAVYMDQNPRQAERLTLAITAGAPLAR